MPLITVGAPPIASQPAPAPKLGEHELQKNLLLNIPVRGDGTIDEKELRVVQDIADWMDVNKECIFGTRPWRAIGEGPALAGAKLTAQGFNEGRGRPFTAMDVRFTCSKERRALYAIVLGAPTNTIVLHSLASSAGIQEPPIRSVRLLGSREDIRWRQTEAALEIVPPKKLPNNFAVVFKITLRERSS